MLRPELLELLVCVIGKSPLREDRDSLVCSRCGVRYPVIGGVPHLLVTDAVLPDGITSVKQLACSGAEVKDA